MDEWLRAHLVCPRDHHSLEVVSNELMCTLGHRYPYVDGIPIMLVDEAEPTHSSCFTTLAQVREGASQEPSDSPDSASVSNDLIDPYVQQAVSGTCGTMYRSLTNRLTRYPIPSLRLPKASEPKLRFLDIGCAWGRWSISAFRQGYCPVGIDPSLDAIKAARRVAKQQGVSANYLVADARHLPFAAESFDIVYSYGVLLHFAKEDVRLVLAESARTLKLSGISQMQMLNARGLRSVWNQGKRGFRKPTHFDARYWTPSELKNTFNHFIGPSILIVDTYVGPGVQPSDRDLLLAKYRMVVTVCELLHRLSDLLPLMRYWADSLYVRSIRERQGDS